MKVIGVGIAGLGNVGGEVVRLLLARGADFRRTLGAELKLSVVCDRGVSAAARKLDIPAGVGRSRRIQDLVTRNEVDIVVELLGGMDGARSLVLQALEKGKRVVTANKALLSRHWDEVFSAASAGNSAVRFEASVAGGIPIIQAVEEGLSANRIRSVLGIFNGTTNYILSEMAHTGLEMEAALRQARRLGMAEKDPTLDLNGSDTQHKLSILASLLSGAWFRPDWIAREGIENVQAEDLRFGMEKLSRTVRLIGTVAFDWSGSQVRVEAHVRPTLVPLKHPLAGVHGGYNAVLVQASAAGDLMFYGKGAGPGPAASAVLADILHFARELAGGEQKLSGPPEHEAAKPRVRPAEESDSAFYLKLRLKDKPGALSAVTGALGREGISISQIHQDRPSGSAVPVMIATHSTSRRALDSALKTVCRQSAVSGKPTVLRLLPE